MEDFGEMMRNELQRNGFTLRAACREMRRDTSMPSRVMNGKQPPSLGLAEDLDKLLGTSRFVKAYKASKRPRRAARAKSTERGLDPMFRRELFRLAGAAGVLAIAPLGASSSSDTFSQLGDYAAVGRHLWKVYGRVETKADVLPSVAEHLQSLHDALSTTPDPRLVALHSEVLQLLGEVFFDAGHSDDAISAYLMAASAAKEADDFDRWACALARYSLVLNSEQRWSDSRNLLTAAERVAARGDSALPTKQWVASVQAEVAAAEGDASAAERAWDTASTVLDLPAPVGNGGWLRFTGDRLPEQRASGYLTLGQYDQAEAELSIALNGSASPRRTAAVLTDQARLAVRQRAYEAALEPARQAVDIATRTSSRYVFGKLQGLQAELPDDDPNTSELAEMLSNAMER